MSKFEVELQQLTGRKKPMGLKKLILQWQKEDGIEIGRQEGIHQNSLAVAQKLKKKD